MNSAESWMNTIRPRGCRTSWSGIPGLTNDGMKTYSFAPISAREYPTVKILDHPHIWGGVQFCVNVSEKPYSPELENAMAAHGIEWVFCPVSEEDGVDWTHSLKVAITDLLAAYKKGKKMVVHCDFGNNRSRAFIEAFLYLLTGTEYADEYKGELNHLAYNCKRGHLPELQETERLIRSLYIDYEQDYQS